MKRILSLLLAMCMVLGLMTGMAVTAFADDTETIAITGVTVPAAGATATTEGITGAPEGFTLSAQWQVYSYEEEDMVSMEDAAFADSGVYCLQITMVAEEGSYLPDDSSYEVTVNGEAVDSWGVDNADENGYTELSVQVLYLVGDVTVIDNVTIESLPAEEAGTPTDLSGIVLPEDAPYELSDTTRWDGDEIGDALEAGLPYALCIYIVPKEGYWISLDVEVSAPREPDYFHIDASGYLNVDFNYDLRPLVKQVEITLDADFAYGDSVEVPVSVPEGANYTVSAAWDTEDETLGYGDYELYFTVTPAEGYFLGKDLTVTINGEPEEESENWYVTHWDDAEAEIFMWTEIAPENGFINDFTLSGAPGRIAAGEAITVPTLEVKKGQLTISKAEWVDAEYAPVSGNFAAGKLYYLALHLTPLEGYALRSGYNANVETADGYDYPFVNASSDGTAVVYVRYSLQTIVDSIAITVTEPVVGAAPAEPKVPAGAKYTIENYYWYDYDYNQEITSFEDNKGYYLEVYVTLAEGYEIDEDVELTINGKEPYGYSNDTDTASLRAKFSFMTQIDRVDVTFPEPTLGGTGSVESIQIPEDAKYSVYQNDSGWYAANSEFTGTFEKDKYMLSLYLAADEGYEFTEDTKLYINGVACEDFYPFQNGSMAECYYEVSFRDQITKIELPALPTVAVGDEATAPELELPEDANYTVFTRWTKYSGNLATEAFTGAFENNNTYLLVLMITPNAGYAFSEETVITVGGEEFAGIQMLGDDYATLMKQYSFGLQVIDKLELTVEAPENGKTPGKITVPEGAHYEINEQSWSVGTDADMQDTKTMKENDTFAYGNYYWVGGSILAKEGYVLAEDAVITVNGQPADLSVLEDIFGFVPVIGDMAVVYHSFGQLTEPAPESKPDTTPTTPPADNPQTGDTVPVMLLAAVAAVSMAALVVIGKKKFA